MTPASDPSPDSETLADRSFESVMGELRQIVDQLEDGELSLEASLTAFERGVRLSREGSRRLEEAEQRVETLLSQNDPRRDLESGETASESGQAPD